MKLRIKLVGKINDFWGLVNYKPRWGLTLQGWLVIILSLIAIFVLMISKLQPFLAYSAPIKADVLVVEGWIGDDALQGAITEFEQGDYQILVTTGIPLLQGQYLSEYKNFAQLSAATLTALGFDSDKLIAIPTPEVKRDRTLTSAIAVRQWLASRDLTVRAINVYSADVHSRRSWLMYKRVFAPDIKVGAIAHPPINYDPYSWWSTSNGVRGVLSESFAYLYAKFASNIFI